MIILQLEASSVLPHIYLLVPSEDTSTFFATLACLNRHESSIHSPQLAMLKLGSSYRELLGMDYLS